ncbi:MAG TPA: hypothetical protein VJJ51_13930 [Candidatus Methanoperedens sp.]|nr:hypothetical protein [Candidatus Methanoperedens sp.]
MNHGYLTFVYLYDPSYPFDFDVPVSIEISSTDYIDVYFVPDREQYENFLANRNYMTISENKQIRSYTRTLRVSKGQGIIIQSVDTSTDVDIHFRYS